MVVIYTIRENCYVRGMRKPYCGWGHTNIKLDNMQDQDIRRMSYDTIPLTPTRTAFAWTYIYLLIYSLIHIFLRPEVLEAMTKKVTVFRDVKPCRLGEAHRREIFSKTLENFYHTTRCHVPVHWEYAMSPIFIRRNSKVSTKKSMRSFHQPTLAERMHSVDVKRCTPTSKRFFFF
jgi:hypothetical protein